MTGAARWQAVALIALVCSSLNGFADECLELDPEFTVADEFLTPSERRDRRDREFARALNSASDCQPSQGDASDAPGGGGGAPGAGDGAASEAANGSTGDASEPPSTPVASGDTAGTDAPPVPQTPPARPAPEAPGNSEREADERTQERPEEAETNTEQPNSRDNGKVPEDIPPARNDDFLAAQIRAAAIAEQDPEKRARLWDEYRRIKGLKTGDGQ